MRRFLTTSLITLSLVLSTMGVAPLAHAENIGNGQACDLTAGSGAGDGFTQNGVCVSRTAYVAASGAGASPTDAASSSDTFQQGLNSIMNSIVGLFAWLLGVAVLILDYTVYYTVINMGSYLSHLTAIGVTWRILRDVGNIMLIFGFLAIGITTILNVSWYGGGKKMLPMLLVAAVFLNFSLFFAEAIVDVGNLFATQFYTQINGGVTPTAFSLSTVSVTNEGISNKLMSQLGLQSIYSDGKSKPELFQKANPWYIGFMGIILFIVTAFVMFSLAFILIARFVKLVYLIIIAPVGFAGLAVPQLAGRAKEWWGDLFKQTITAPVLLLLLYVALAVITDAQFLTGIGGGSAGAATGFVNNGNVPGFASYLLSFVIAISLLIAVAMSATRLGAFGGSLATKSAGALTFGATAWGLNRTVARGAYYAQRGLRQSATFNKVNAATGRIMTRGLDRAATASYDIRGIAAGGGLAGLKIDAGAAQKGGFTEARTKSLKEHEEETKRIETSFKEGFNEKDKEKAVAQEEEARAAAELAKTEAQKAKDKAQQEHDTAETLKKQHAAEVERLSAVDKADRDAGRPSSVGAALRAAQGNLETSETNLKTVSENLTKATTNLTEATTAEEKAKTAKEGAEKGAMQKSINESKEAYAAGITNKLAAVGPNLLAYGPGAGAAAKKIRDSMKDKSTKDKAKDLFKQMMKEEEGGVHEKKEESKKEEKKPEAAH
ncbi:MAG: hypothetical protein ACHQU0_00180 [Candidatus Paceibacteria bacterium]